MDGRLNKIEKHEQRRTQLKIFCFNKQVDGAKEEVVIFPIQDV